MLSAGGCTLSHDQRCARLWLGLRRFIGTPRSRSTGSSSGFQKATLPDSQVIVFARDDDYFFGVLHSRHTSCGRAAWARSCETRAALHATTTFETFPLPETRREDAVAEVGGGRACLNELRVGWLNPPGMTRAELAKRTLTNLYNQRPSWLAQVHERLDRAVYAAYGWQYPLDGR